VTRTAFLLALLLAGCQSPNLSADEHLVRDFTEAFSQHDIEAMASYLSEDAAWMSVVGDTLMTDAIGRENIKMAMTGYFEQITDVTSEIESSQSLSPFVTAIERVTWNGGQSTQRAIAVYEIEDGLIARVWYHAAVR
jgi:uncharacterized protein (TIGR02246 family)